MALLAQDRGVSSRSPVSEASVAPTESAIKGKKKISVAVDTAPSFGQTPDIALYLRMFTDALHVCKETCLIVFLCFLYISTFINRTLSGGTLDHWERAEW